MSTDAKSSIQPSESVKSCLVFPEEAIVGSLGLYAKAMAEGTEVPTEFHFAAGLTFLGALCGAKLSIHAKLEAEARLFTVLLGESGEAHKSTAIVRGKRFFEELQTELFGPVHFPIAVVEGTGSAEGLARVFASTPNIVLCYDELKALIDKSKVQASVLLPMVTSLFEKTSWANYTKDKPIEVPDAHLSLLGGCTLDTYESMWTPDALNIGLTNRLFTVMADRRTRIAWPESGAGAATLQEARKQIIAQLKKLPLKLDIAREAKARWERWYTELPSSVHTKRLDAIGVRLLMLFALMTDKEAIDLETVENVIKVLDYELAVRTVTDPIDADGSVARMEQNIRRQLTTLGPLTKNQLKQRTNANRSGLWVFETALKNLIAAPEISGPIKGLYQIGP